MAPAKVAWLIERAKKTNEGELNTAAGGPTVGSGPSAARKEENERTRTMARSANELRPFGGPA